MASSLEGTKIRTCMFFIFGFNSSIIGNKKANVFHVPVGDNKIISEFEEIASCAASCIGFNAKIPSLVRISC